MKIGQALRVFIQADDGQTFEVSSAVIEHIENDEATIVIPATRVVMGIKHSLDNRTPEVDRAFGGLVEGQGDGTSEAAKDVNNDLLEATMTTPGQQIGGTYGSDVGEGIHNKNLDSSVLD